MPLSTRKRLILAKIETTYGTDSLTATTGAEALLVRNLDVTPLNADAASRDLVKFYYGNSEQLLSKTSSTISFEVELAGSGTAGTAPKYDPVLQACALAPTSGGGSVTYNPVSASIKSCTIYINVDGVLHKFTGCRGTMSMNCSLGQIPTLKFDLTSIYNEPTDAAALSPTYDKQATPLIFKQGNTTAFTFFTTSTFCLSSFEFNLANEITYRELVNCNKEVIITDRKPAGSVMIEAPLTATKNFFNLATTDTTGGLTFLHGLNAGNRVTFTANQVDITAPTYSDMDGIVMLSVPFVAIPTTAGNNEFSLAYS
jgi:hypothetical protein